jgi:hypothetical protein
MESLNSILSALKGLETIKEQFFKHDLFKSACDFGYAEGHYNLLNPKTAIQKAIPVKPSPA